jgi:hypothetical protein
MTTKRGIMKSYNEQKISCEKKLRKNLGLRYPPKVSVVNRNYQGREDFAEVARTKLSICSFTGSDDVSEPSEYNDIEEFLYTPMETLKNLYCQLNHDRIKGITNYKSYLIETHVEFAGNQTVSAGYDWVFLGKLSNEDRFCSVLSLFVRDMFKGCGLSSLVKWKEIELANKNRCDFIQTYHEADNPYFIAAITPSLKHNFVLYHGKKTAGEKYEGAGYIHLRKYLTRKPRSDVAVEFSNRQIFRSNKENSLILEYLKKCGETSGEEIVRIEQYGD